MNPKRLYYLLVGTICLLVLGLLAGAYITDKLLIAESKTLLHNRLQTAVLDAEAQQLSKAKADITKYSSLATIAQSVVPQDKDQVQTVRQIVDIAKSYGISLASITFPTSTLGNPAVGSKTAAGSFKLSQLSPVKGISGVYNLQLTVTSDPVNPVPYSQFINFLMALEHNRRTALISGITLEPNSKDRSTLSFTLTLNEYIKP